MPHSSNPFDTLFQQGSKPQPTNKPQPLLQARKVDRSAPSQNNGEVTYCVIDMPAKSGKGNDRRRDPARKRTRLRCGKILDMQGKFLIECQIHDRSIYGAHLRPMNMMALPRHIKFYDDEQRALLDAEVIWRKNGEIGIQFLTKLDAQAIRSGKRSALASKYYAVN
jgi:hypothetical protein